MKCAFCGNPLDESRPYCPSCGKPTTPAREGDEVSIAAVRIDDVLLGRYHLESKLGEGGMGTVYLAHDRELDRRVAVKLLASSYVGDKEVVERFEREARLTARLDHPNIVPVYDVGRHEGRPFIVMKKLEGQSLAFVLREKGGFTRDETLRLLRQLAAGVDFIHAQGFIHRDIKAGNIFVGSDGQATILDFGILRPARGKEALTRTGMVMGTPHYMAPEQALGIKNVDHRVDLYALAVVIFECLTGTLPFEAESELRLIQMQAHQPPPDLLERAPWIPKAVAAVMKRGLSKVPEERFGSAGELVAAIEAAWTANLPPSLANTGLRKEPAVPDVTAPSLRRAGDSGVGPVRATPRPGSDAARLGGKAGSGEVPSTSELERAVRRSRAPAVVLGLLLFGAAAGTWYLLEGRLPVPVAAVDAGAAVGPVAAADAGGGPGEGELAAVDAGAAGEPSADAGATALALADAADAGEADEPDAGAGPGEVAQVRKLRRGKLTVITTHRGEPFWAQVSIDGVDRGRTPLNLELSQGNYRVRVERPGLKSESRQIWVASGQSRVVRIDLRQ